MNKMVLAGARMLSVEEASHYAGGFDDPARLVASFAGVAPGVSTNGISIHGNAPHLLQWRLEDVEIPNPNYFADITSLGGGILFEQPGIEELRFLHRCFLFQIWECRIRSVRYEVAQRQ